MPNLQSLLDSQKPFVGVRANFVVSADGKFVGDSESSRDISNEEDLALLKKLRSLSDVIVTDANTARKEHYRPSKWAPIQIWSRTGNFTGLSEESGVSLETSPDAVEALAKLARQYPRVLLEAGPTLTRVLADAESIDELKLTIVGLQDQQTATELATMSADSLGLSYLQILDVKRIRDTWFLTLGR